MTSPYSLPRASQTILGLPEELRLQIAIGEWNEGGIFQTKKAAALHYGLSYKVFWARLRGQKPIAQNGSNNMLLRGRTEVALHAWVKSQVSLGVQINSLYLAQAATWFLGAGGQNKEACIRWARRYMNRHPDLFEPVERKKPRTGKTVEK